MKHKPMKWTVHAAAVEFQMSRETLSKRLRKCGAKPDAAGCFSTLEICEAIFDSLHTQKVRLARAQAEMAERKSRQQDRKLVETDAVASAWAEIVLDVKRGEQALPGQIQSRLSLTVEQVRIAEQLADDVLTSLARDPNYFPEESPAEPKEEHP